MPLYPGRDRLRWSATVDQELTGAVSTVQAYAAAGAYDTIPGRFLRDDDVVEYGAEWEVTGFSGATNFVPNIYWGGVASGVALLKTSTVIASAAGQIVRASARVTVKTAGASPVWHSSGLWFLAANPTYQDQVGVFGRTSISTLLPIPVEASGQFVNGTPAAGDKAKLRSFARQILRRAA